MTPTDEMFTMQAMTPTPDDLASIDLATRRTLAEAAKLEAEARKLEAERRKNDLEADALHRWRNVAMPASIASVLAAMLVAIGAIGAKVFGG